MSSSAEPEQTARLAGLRYVTDATAGITRRLVGRGFSYRDPKGVRIDDEQVIARIKGLAVPPAWEDVWICTFENGHPRRPAATPAAASNIATTRSGTGCAGRTSSAAWWTSVRFLRDRG